MVKLYFKVSEEFTNTPGPALKSQGKYSGEEFVDILIPILNEAIDSNRQLIVDLDGLYGLPNTFCNSIARNLAIRYTRFQIFSTIIFKCWDSEAELKKLISLIDEWYKIINDRESMYIDISETSEKVIAKNKGYNIPRIAPKNKFISSVYMAIQSNKNIIVKEKKSDAQTRVDFANILIILCKIFNSSDVLEHVLFDFKDEMFNKYINTIRRSL